MPSDNQRDIEPMTYETWYAEGKRLFGSNMLDWKFECPVCHNVASVRDFKDAGAKDSNSATCECIGRYRKERDHVITNGHAHMRPCDYAGYGLFKLSPVRVLFPDGKVSHCFAFATPETS